MGEEFGIILNLVTIFIIYYFVLTFNQHKTLYPVPTFAIDSSSNPYKVYTSSYLPINSQ